MKCQRWMVILVFVIISTIDLYSQINPECEAIGITGPFGFTTELILENPGAVQQGDRLCIKFKSKNFQSVIAYQHSLSFDPTELCFEAFFGGNALLGPLNANLTRTEEGILHFVWFNINAEGETLPDETLIFTLCFDACSVPSDCYELGINDFSPDFPSTEVNYQVGAETCSNNQIFIDNLASTCIPIECIDSPVINNKHKFQLGAKWTYEQICVIPNRVGYITYEVVDTLTVNNNPCFVFNNGDTICTEGNKVFALDHRLTDGLQLLFDYDEDERISFECYEPNLGIENYDITINSSTTERIADGQCLNMRYVDTFCANGWIGNLKTMVYEGIGSNIIKPFPCLDFCNDIASSGTCEVGKLRCFENSSENYCFVDYACDSIWMTSNTSNINKEKFIIYPNPTDGIVFVKQDSDNLSYTLSTIQGELIKKGKYSTRGITLPFKGMFLLTLIDGSHRKWTQKITMY